MSQEQYDRDGFKLDVDQVPDIEDGPPQVPQLKRGLILAGAVVVGVGAIGGIGHALWTKQHPPATESQVTLAKPSKIRAQPPDWAKDKPVPLMPEPMPSDVPTQDPMKAITLTANQAAAARGEPVDPCLDDSLTPQQAVDCERNKEARSPLLEGADKSDRAVAAHRHGGGGWQPGGDYAANTGKRLREDENGDEGDAYDDYLPAKPKRQERTVEQEELSPPPSSLGTLGGLRQQLAGLQQTKAALQAVAAANGGGMDQEDRKESFSRQEDGIPTLDGDEEEVGECEIGAGDPVKGNLTVAINSDVPAQNTVKFEVNETVYCGGDRQHIAVPQGSTLIGSFNARVGYGDERIQLCFKELKRRPSAGHPNGTRKAIGCAVGADIVGAIGIPADVDNHWDKVIGGSLLSALLGMAPNAAAGNQTGFAPTIAQQAAAQAGNNLNQAGQRVVQRELQRKPTLRTEILEGATVIFTSNVPLEPWVPRKVRGLKKRPITWVRK